MIARILGSYLVRDSRHYPVLTLTGPRQSGKTTLARATFPEHAYVSLEEPESRSFAREDPRGFLRRYGTPTVIDEVQRVPDLLSYLQTAVDADSTPGRYVLTGSHNFLLMHQVSQTLAGRCAVLHLLPFSRAELEGQPQEEPSDLRTLFSNRATHLERWLSILTGFYPRIHDRGIPSDVWLSDYVQTYVERDLRTLVNVGDLETFERFLALCAGRVGQLLSFSAIASDTGVAVDTIRRWISAIKTSFLVFLLRPHHRNYRKRLAKSPKLYFYDTGIACHLLGIRTGEQLFAHPLRGALFENYIIAEVAKAFLNHRREPPISFWRDHTGHEVDLLIEEAQELFPVEIKSSETISRDMLEGLEWWCRLAGRSPSTAALIYGGAEAYTRSEIAVRPWFSV